MAATVEAFELEKKREDAFNKKTRLNRRSILNIIGTVKRSYAKFDSLWNIAHRAPVFCKKPRLVKVRDRKTGKIVDRKVMNAIRILSSHKYATFGSNALAQKTFQIADLAQRLRTLSSGTLENARAPALLRVSNSFKSLVDQATVAYIMNVLSRAKCYQEGMKKHKKLTFRCVDIAAKSMDNDLFVTSGLHPHVGILQKPKSAAKSRVKGKVAKKSVSEGGRGRGRPKKQKAAQEEE